MGQSDQLSRKVNHILLVTKKAFHRSRAAFVCRGLRTMRFKLDYSQEVHRLKMLDEPVFVSAKSLSPAGAFVKNFGRSSLPEDSFLL